MYDKKQNTFDYMTFYHKKTTINATQFSWMGILFILSFIGINNYFDVLERICYGDTALHLFKIIIGKTFFIPHHRYSLVFFEIFPLLGIWAQSSFKTVLYLFSYSHYAIILMLTLLYYMKTKNILGTWVLTISSVIGMSHSYYYYIIESYLGYTISLFSVLFYSYLFENKKSHIWIFTLISSILIVGCHSYYFSIVFLGLLYIWIQNTSLYKNIIIQCSIIIFVVMLYNMIYSPDGYELDRMHIFKQNLSHYKELDKAAFSMYFQNTFTYDYKLNLFLTFIIGISIYLKKYKELAVGVIALIAGFYLNCIYSYEWQSSHYMDQYGRLIFYFGFTSLFFILNKSRISNFIISIIFIAYFFIQWNFITKISSQYEFRIQWMTEILKVMDAKKINKLILNTKDIDYQYVLMDWAVAYESILLSTFLNSPKSILILDSTELKEKNLNSSLFISKFYSDSMSHIKGTYFNDIIQQDYNSSLIPK